MGIYIMDIDGSNVETVKEGEINGARLQPIP